MARPVYEWLGRQTCPVVRLDDYQVEQDFVHDNFHAVCCPDQAWFTAFSQAWINDDQGWLTDWQTAETEGQTKRDQFIVDTDDWVEHAAAQIIFKESQHYHLLHIGNSMAMRHASLFCDGHAIDLRISVNRGLNGIDGTLATFLADC